MRGEASGRNWKSLSLDWGNMKALLFLTISSSFALVTFNHPVLHNKSFQEYTYRTLWTPIMSVTWDVKFQNVLMILIQFRSPTKTTTGSSLPPTSSFLQINELHNYCKWNSNLYRREMPWIRLNLGIRLFITIDLEYLELHPLQGRLTDNDNDHPSQPQCSITGPVSNYLMSNYGLDDIKSVKGRRGRSGLITYI